MGQRMKPAVGLLLATLLLAPRDSGGGGGPAAGDGDAAGDVDDGPVVLLRGEGEAEEAAPHGRGNVYAPDVLVEGGVYRMWYGAQGRDGHDRILYAESRDG